MIFLIKLYLIIVDHSLGCGFMTRLKVKLLDPKLYGLQKFLLQIVYCVVV